MWHWPAYVQGAPKCVQKHAVWHTWQLPSVKLDTLAFYPLGFFLFSLSIHFYKVYENIYMIVQMLSNNKNNTLLRLTWRAGGTFMC